MRYAIHRGPPHDHLPYDRLTHDRAHKDGWNSALDSLECALRDDLAKGQLVRVEDVIQRIRRLMDPEPPGPLRPS